MKREALKVSVSGVRGVVGDSFTPQLAASFAQAFGAFVGRGPVLVGRDTRPSGAMIEYAVVAGLQSVGCKPILCGITPTPTMLIQARLKGVRGGIVITASHNAAPWNALKFIGPDGLFLSETRSQELFDLYHQQDFPLAEEPDLLTRADEKYPAEAHFKKIAQYVDTQAIQKRKLRVAVDGCNGVGALFSPFLLQTVLGCELVPIHDTPSGRFEREPEPLPRNLGALCEAVVERQCDIGFAQDPDGDRLAVVDEKGTPIGEDLTLGLAVRQVLDAHDKGPVAVNLSTSKAVEWIARERGVPVVKTKIGEIHVARAMIDEECVVGGENNGGIMIARIHPCRDSFAGMAVILELLAQSGKTVSQLREEIPAYYGEKDKIRIRSDQASVILREIRRAYKPGKLHLLDGVYIDLDNAWVHVRRSNTEPVIRITAEADSPEKAKELAVDMRERIEGLLATM